MEMTSRNNNNIISQRFNIGTSSYNKKEIKSIGFYNHEIIKKFMRERKKN